MASPAPTWISKKEAAERIGRSEKKIDRLRTAGELHAVKRGNEPQSPVEIEVASLDAYLACQRQTAEPRPAWDDIEKRFPIPELDQARAASAARRAEASKEEQ